MLHVLPLFQCRIGCSSRICFNPFSDVMSTTAKQLQREICLFDLLNVTNATFLFFQTNFFFIDIKMCYVRG